MTISLPVDPDANELLSRDPLALLIGMLLDQQVPLEKAFSGPRDLVRRLGHEPTAGNSRTLIRTRWPRCSATGPPCTVTRGPWRPGPRTWPG